MRARFIDFGASLNFGRDDIQRLEDNRVFREMVRGCERTSPALLDSGALAVSWSPLATDSGVWKIVQMAGLCAALPHRFDVYLRLRVRNPAGVGRGDWKSVHAECLINALGIAVNIRFGLGEIPRADAVTWPGKTELCLLDKSGKETWNGGVSALCFEVARATLDALGIPWRDLETSTWRGRLDSALHRIYTEFQAESDPVPPKLLYGLAVQKPGWEQIACTQIKKTYRPGPLKQGESCCFTKDGCALILSAASDAAWQAANCHRRNVVYSLALHQLAVNHLHALIDELTLGDGKPRPQFDDILLNDVSRTLSQTRFATLLKLQQKYRWLRYYSRNVAEWLHDLPEDTRSRVVTQSVWGKLLEQLGEFNPQNESVDPETES